MINNTQIYVSKKNAQIVNAIVEDGNAYVVSFKDGVEFRSTNRAFVQNEIVRRGKTERDEILENLHTMRKDFPEPKADEIADNQEPKEPQGLWFSIGEDFPNYEINLGTDEVRNSKGQILKPREGAGGRLFYGLRHKSNRGSFFIKNLRERAQAEYERKKRIKSIKDESVQRLKNFAEGLKK